MNTTMTTANIQDYIVDLAGEKNSNTTYTIVLENNTDFIIRRTTPKTERELVVLISQGLFYFKDNRNGKIDSVSLSSIKSFLRELRDGLRLEHVYWLQALSKESSEIIERIITDEVYVDMCRHNVLVDVEHPEWYRRFWIDNSKLFMQLHTIFPSTTDIQKYKASIPLIFELDKKLGYNEAIYFAEQLVKTGIEHFTPSQNYRYHYSFDNTHDAEGFIKLIENPQYNLQFRRFVDYILFDLYGQGIVSIDNHFWREYGDYLDMQILFYGKVKEKYPSSFKTAHDVITLKINQVKAIQECQNFEERSMEIADMAYQNGQYCIVVPFRPEELAEEGVNLSHCVKSYIKRVSSGECHILFLRKASMPDTSLVTVQLSGKSIIQAQGYNRRNISKEEKKFLLRWANEKKLDCFI